MQPLQKNDRVGNREAVAKAAGVSPSTVSRALAGSSLIPQSTRERVETAAAALGYVPSLLSRSHYTGRSFRLGAVIPLNNRANVNEYLSRMIYGMMAAAETRHYAITVVADATLSAEALIQKVRSRSVDGLLLLSTSLNDKRFATLHKENIPFLLLHNYVSTRPYLFAECDSRPGMTEAFRHLKNKGCERIGYLSGHDHSRDGVDREALFHELVETFGLKKGVVLKGQFSRMSGRAAADQLPLKQLPDAILCANDRMAFGFIEGLQARRLSIPKDVRVVGFDDQSIATLISPTMTTIQNPFEEIAEQGVLQLLNAIEGKPHHSVTLPSRFVERESA